MRYVCQPFYYTFCLKLVLRNIRFEKPAGNVLLPVPSFHLGGTHQRLSGQFRLDLILLDAQISFNSLGGVNCFKHWGSE